MIAVKSSMRATAYITEELQCTTSPTKPWKCIEYNNIEPVGHCRHTCSMKSTGGPYKMTDYFLEK